MNDIRGLASAIERFGKPIVWERSWDVSAETLAYWQGLEDRRTAEVVLLIRRPNGRYLLHTKAFYPPGVFRLLSGGIHPGEDIIDAALREAYEETGLEIEVERFIGVLCQRFIHNVGEFLFTSFVFEAAEVGGQLATPDDDEEITGYREITAEELEEVARTLESLPPAWQDWGRFRAAAHRLAAQVLCDRGNR